MGVVFAGELNESLLLDAYFGLVGAGAVWRGKKTGVPGGEVELICRRKLNSISVPLSDVDLEVGQQGILTH